MAPVLVKYVVQDEEIDKDDRDKSIILGLLILIWPGICMIFFAASTLESIGRLVLELMERIKHGNT